MMPREQFAETQIPAQGKDEVPYPSWREIARRLLSHGAEMFFGTVEGTGALITVAGLPFDPACVILLNVDGLAWAVKTPNMASADSVKFITAGTMSVAVAAVTLGTKQFTIGADADLNVAAETIHWIAFGARDVDGSS